MSLLGYDYEVFLSFRRPDTRAGITDFLYMSLTDAGIHAYRDYKDLRDGEEMGPELLQAIHLSKISIPIFSRGISTWCLRELVQMVKCKKTQGQIIMPIFYDVAPWKIRLQTGVYGMALSLHETKKRYGDETIREWRESLKETAGLKGWDLSMPNKHEGEVVKEVVNKVFGVLKKAYLVVPVCLAGVDHHVGKIMRMLGAQTQETQILGIHGMGGIEKTTLTKIVYNLLLHDFEDCGFLSNIRETSELHGIEWVRNKLISDVLKQKMTDREKSDEGIKMIKERLSSKKVLLLDDVNKNIQLNALMEKRNWLNEGSKIIITASNKHILIIPEVDFTYDLTCMDFEQSFQLFSKHLFKRDYPPDEYVTLSHKAVDIIGGLPLALEVMGSRLSSTSNERWDAKLKMLEKTPDLEVQNTLKEEVKSPAKAAMAHLASSLFDMTELSLINLAVLDLSWSELTESWDG
ncbi:disease resistance protein RUN1-like [Rhodamnia argentea]|uniref:Disease resistance protein RUN1-like n=1 Tax=Rhodamnia argentea TaxID=178133 RepID=A0A8B8P0T8_9MYRT|nr:disease resistance protein RUN1-like [Rhodamnia argentea]